MFSMASQHQLAKIAFVKVWVTRLPSLSHPPLSMWRHRVTCLPPKNASASWGGPGSLWLTIIVRQVSYINTYSHAKNRNDLRPVTLSKVPFPEVGFSTVAILGGGWLQSPASDGPPCSGWFPTLKLVSKCVTRSSIHSYAILFVADLSCYRCLCTLS